MVFLGYFMLTLLFSTIFGAPIMIYREWRWKKAEYERLTADMTPEEKLEFDRKIFIASHGRSGKGEE